jgi:ATP-binding cassette subfamily F protein uup
VKRGQTVRLAELSQDTAEIPEHMNVIEALEEARLIAELSDGKEISASQLCDRFGFRGGRSQTLVKDLSGGERRRLQLMRLLMEEPNVLLLDEPTNDLDIDTLTALEDLLDSWPGTLIVVSHDRYFVERVCDDVYGLMGDGELRHLPGGIEQYVESRRVAGEAEGECAVSAAAQPKTSTGAMVHAARKEAKQVQKEVRRIERELEQATKREADLHEEMVESSTDHKRLRGLQAELAEVVAKREELEVEWLVTSELLEA